MGKDRSFFSELGRRKVYRTAAAYVVAVLAIWGGVEIASEAFGWPDRVLQLVVIGSVAGFPVALFVAWVFELRLERHASRSGEDAPQSVSASLRPALVVVASLAVLIIAAFSFQVVRQSMRLRWVSTEVVPDIDRLRAAGDLLGAYELVDRARKLVPGDPTLATAWEELSVSAVVTTDPSGAEVIVVGPEGVQQHLGTTPLDTVSLPLGVFHWRFEKQGFDTVEFAADLRTPTTLTLDVVLRSGGTVPNGMVAVEGDTYVAGVRLPGLRGTAPAITLPPFFIDRFEITNREFKQFLDAGGYDRQEFWVTEFVSEGRVVEWKEAMAEFTDVTGLPGPSTWVAGTFPVGHGADPVGGVSWYEAAAFAEWAGKSLPTIYQWDRAAAVNQADWIIPTGNFGGVGPVAVGSTGGIGPWGTYDMAGNVKEWVWNSSGSEHYALGGSWIDPEYMFHSLEVRPPFDRRSELGFRLVMTDGPEPLPGQAYAELAPSERDFYSEQPVSDDVFEAFRAQYLYDDSPLDSLLTLVEDSDRWRWEKATVNTAYGDERMDVHIFLPKTGTPPYRTVVYFPGAGALRTTALTDPRWAREFATNGRAFVIPILRGTFDRKVSGQPTHGIPTPDQTYKRFLISWVQDVMRSIDYLETRDDLDLTNLAYFGVSWGGRLGAIVPAVESRLKVAVLSLVGLDRTALREVDALNYVTRVTIPVMMLVGEHDYIFPLESSSRPMYDLLGTSDELKRLVPFNASHNVSRLHYNDVLRYAFEFLDMHQGGVVR